MWCYVVGKTRVKELCWSVKTWFQPRRVRYLGFFPAAASSPIYIGSTLKLKFGVSCPLSMSTSRSGVPVVLFRRPCRVAEAVCGREFSSNET